MGDRNFYNFIEVFTGSLYILIQISWIMYLRYVHFTVYTFYFNEKEKCQVTGNEDKHFLMHVTKLIEIKILKMYIIIHPKE